MKYRNGPQSLLFYFQSVNSLLQPALSSQRDSYNLHLFLYNGLSFVAIWVNSSHYSVYFTFHTTNMNVVSCFASYISKICLKNIYMLFCPPLQYLKNMRLLKMIITIK